MLVDKRPDFCHISGNKRIKIQGFLKKINHEIKKKDMNENKGQ